MNIPKVRLAIGLICGALMAIVTSQPQSVFAADTRSPELRMFELYRNGSQVSSQHQFLSFDANDQSGGTVAVCDLNGDGSSEVVVGSGAGKSPEVKVFGITGNLIASFAPYDSSMMAGVNVACGNLNADKKGEIVVGPGNGGAAHIRVFGMKGKPRFTLGFFAYDTQFRGGANVAVGNIDGKKGDEIITGAGPGGGAQVRVFNKKGKSLGMDFFPFSSEDHGGVTVAVANVDGGTEEEIVMGIQSFGSPLVKVYKADTERTVLGEFLAYDSTFYGGVSVAGADLNRDGLDEIITSPRQGGGPQVRLFTATGQVVGMNGFMAYEEDFRGGMSIAAGNIDADGKAEVIVMPLQKSIEGRTDFFKYIDVDLSEQTLRAYKNGVKENEFLVSTGVDRYPTPTGEFPITAKLPLHDYKWSYGTDHPDNYDIPDVPYNLRFLPTVYIHNAYWHNNFGHKMSHGCVNVNLENARWIYEWATVGTMVVIHD